MVDSLLRDIGIRVERVRIIAESGQVDAVFRAQRVHVVRLCLGEAEDIDVRDAGVFALGLADGPAHCLDAGKALVARKGQDLL
jgi:hypothetical protein